MGFKHVIGVLLGVLLAAATFVGKADAVCPEGGPAPCLGRYGEFPNVNLLIPWFRIGQSDVADPTTLQDTLIVEIDLQNATPVTSLDVTFWTVGSTKCFNKCVPSTASDVVPLSVLATFQGAPAPAKAACGFVDETTETVGYVTIETFTGPNCSGDPVPEGILGFVYYTDLQQGRAAGIMAPTFAGDPFGVGNPFDEFAVDPDQSMVFRILNGLDLDFDGPDADDDDAAETLAVIWSDTNGGANFEDGTFLVCDEEEVCFSLTPPSIPDEVNFIPLDDFLVAGSGINGWLVLHNASGSPHNVLGYSDNRATSPAAGLNWEVIFPAPLVNGNPLP